jgi:autotransporter translocation and assembly factor TamB
MEENINNTTPTEETEEVKTYTAEEVDALLQSEADRRVTSAMKKKEREIAALKKQIENEKTLSQLDEESRATAEKDMKIAELEGQLKDFQMAQTKNEVMKVLNARGLSAEFADMLAIGTDTEEAQQMIDSFDKLFKKEVAREVKARLAETSAVPQIADAMSGKMTKEQFNKLSLAEQQAMYNSDPELVKNLLG